jgi:prepilin-type N-terminal cleavage/methylation domain-containing protein
MRSTATKTPASRPLAVEWLEETGARPITVAMHPAPPRFFFAAKPSCAIRKRGTSAGRRVGQNRAFTLLELIMVMAIIGFIAAMTLPHVGNYNRANTVSAAARQMLDDVARARSRAMANRAVVYMVFVPPYWNYFIGAPPIPPTPAFTNLLGHQYMSYALLSTRTVGDQPGQNHPRYLTEWQTLPSGVYFWPWQFTPQFATPSPPVAISTTNTFTGATNLDIVSPLATAVFPFPSLNDVIDIGLPYIGFTPQGTLLTPTNQYIVLTRGSIIYPQGPNGVYTTEAGPTLVEVPPGNETNNPCMIKIDWLTARGSIVQNQFQ